MESVYRKISRVLKSNNLYELLFGESFTFVKLVRTLTNQLKDKLDSSVFSSSSGHFYLELPSFLGLIIFKLHFDFEKTQAGLVEFFNFSYSPFLPELSVELRGYESNGNRTFLIDDFPIPVWNEETLRFDAYVLPQGIDPLIEENLLEAISLNEVLQILSSYNFLKLNEYFPMQENSITTGHALVLLKGCLNLRKHGFLFENLMANKPLLASRFEGRSTNDLSFAQYYDLIINTALKVAFHNTFISPVYHITFEQLPQSSNEDLIQMVNDTCHVNVNSSDIISKRVYLQLLGENEYFISEASFLGVFRSKIAPLFPYNNGEFSFPSDYLNRTAFDTGVRELSTSIATGMSALKADILDDIDDINTTIHDEFELCMSDLLKLQVSSQSNNQLLVTINSLFTSLIETINKGVLDLIKLSIEGNSIKLQTSELSNNFSSIIQEMREMVQMLIGNVSDTAGSFNKIVELTKVISQSLEIRRETKIDTLVKASEIAANFSQIPGGLIDLGKLVNDKEKF